MISLGVSSAYAAEPKASNKKSSSSKKSKVSSKKSKKSRKAKKSPDFYDLSIIWETEAIGKKDKKDWKEACKKLSANFKLDPKSGSQGVFRKVKCIGARKKVNFKAMPTDWFLVMNSNNNVKMDVYYRTLKETKKSAHIDFGATPKLLEALKDEQVSTLIASALLDQLPFRFASYLKPVKNTKVNSPKSLRSVVAAYNKSLTEKDDKKSSSKKERRKKPQRRRKRMKRRKMML